MEKKDQMTLKSLSSKISTTYETINKGFADIQDMFKAFLERCENKEISASNQYEEVFLNIHPYGSINGVDIYVKSVYLNDYGELCAYYDDCYTLCDNTFSNLFDFLDMTFVIEEFTNLAINRLNEEQDGTK